MSLKIKLKDWAARRYDPPPSAFILAKWHRSGELQPAPERVGKEWYIDENARRIAAGQRVSLVDRLRAG